MTETKHMKSLKERMNITAGGDILKNFKEKG